MVIGRRSPSLAPQNGISEGDSAALVASRAASSERRIPRAEGRHSVALKLTPNASPCVLLRPRGLSSSAGSRLVRRMGLESYDSGGRGRGLRSRGSQAAGRPLHICTDRTGPRERLHPTACRASPLPPCPPPRALSHGHRATLWSPRPLFLPDTWNRANISVATARSVPESPLSAEVSNWQADHAARGRAAGPEPLPRAQGGSRAGPGAVSPPLARTARRPGRVPGPRARRRRRRRSPRPRPPPPQHA